MPATWAWVEGQVTWLLLPLLTEAWIAARINQPLRSGAWLAAVVAMRPPLALMALVLPWRICLTAVIGSALLTAVSVAFVGWSPFAAWLEQQGQINWLPDPMNGSLWGLVARIGWSGRPVHLGDLPAALIVVVLVTGVLLAFAVLRAEGDRRWVLALLWSTLLSPLGWVYYLPLALGPMASLRPFPRPLTLAIVASVIPWPVLSLIFGATLNPLWASLLSGCVLLAFTACTWPRSSPAALQAVELVSGEQA